MATVDKNFKIKNGLIVGDSTNLVNYTSASPFDPFVGQLWIDNSDTLYAWSGSAWVSVGGGGSASGTPFNISNTLVARSASGTFSIGAIDLDTTASPALSIGRIQWNPNFGTPEVGLVGGNVTAHIGQHVHAYVTNAEGSPLVKGDVVYLFGSAGDRASVKKASNTSDTTSSKTLGVVAEAIGTGQNGFVTVFGVVDRLNLSAYSSGDVLWLSASAGIFTNIKPSAPQHLVFVGVVARANAGNGQLFVNVQNGYELEELHSVSITNLTDNDILSYNGSSSLWFNQNLATAIQEVDGAGSGIDADLLDSHQASYFINTSSATQEKLGTMTFHGTVNIEDLVITGSAVTISSTNLALTDSLIQLAHEQYTTDAVDIGIVGSYGDGTTSSAAHYHTSFARDASQNKWKLLSKGPAPVNNVIDYSDPSVEFGILQVGSIEVSSSATVNNLNADLLDNQHGFYYLDWTNTTNKPDPIIGVNLTGNTTAAASVTLTDLTNGQISLTTNTNFATSASSINWSGVTNKPDPVIGINLTGNTTAAASATLTDLSNGQISLVTNTNFSTSASSINWIGVTNKPDPIIGINLTGNTTGAASATLTDLTNGQISITTNTAFASTASSINWAGVTGRPTTLSGYGITDAIPVSSSVQYLTKDSASTLYINRNGDSVTGKFNIYYESQDAFAALAVTKYSASSYTDLQVTEQAAFVDIFDPINNKQNSFYITKNGGNLSITQGSFYFYGNFEFGTANVTGLISPSANFALHANTASSINWSMVTGTPTTLLGYGITDGLRSSDAASAYIRVTSSAAIVSGYIPTSASQEYLTRSDAVIIYAPLASASLTGIPVAPTASRNTNTPQIATTAFVLGQANSASSLISMDGIPSGGVSALYARADHAHPSDISRAPIASASLTGVPIAPTASPATNTQQIATTAFVRTEVSNLIASAPATLDTLNELAAALGNDPNFATSTASAIGQRLLASTASTLYMSIGSTANHATSASSINWNGVTNRPDPIIGVSLSGNTSGAASVTLTDLNNGQISITTNTAHANTASSIAGALVTGTVNNANHTNTASSINSSLITGTTLPAAIVNSSLTNVGTLGSLTVSGNLTVDTDTLFIDSINNRVGIRTTSPSATLHVNATSTTAPSLTWGANSGQILRNENSELAIGLSNSNPFPLYFQGRTNTNTSRQIVLQPLGGNVGIGGDPSRTFTVVGTASFTGDISAPTHSGLLLGNAMTASSIAGSLVTGTVNNANQANTASSINISGVTGLASNISTFLQTPTSANLAAAVTDESGTAGAVAFTNNPTFTGTLNAQTIDATNGILVEAYTKDNINLRTDGGFFQTSIATTASGWPQTTNSWYHLISSTHSNTGNYYSMQFAGSFYDSNALFYRATNGSGTTSWNQLWHSGNISAASVSWGNVSNKPDPIIGVNLLGDVTGAASATLTDLTNGQITINTTVAANSVALGTDTTGNYVAGATAGNGITISGTAGEGWSPTIELNAAASVSWGNVSSKPSPIIGVNLTGNTTGAASATLTQLTNGQISIVTKTSHADTASFVHVSNITGLGSNISTFLTTPTSANLASSVTDETGTGRLVFSNSASFDGVPTAPTASVGQNTNQIATTAFVYSMLVGIDGGVPSSTYDFAIDGGSV